MRIADQNGYSDGPIFDDLSDVKNCSLPAISWVIPDWAWSDHPQDSGNAQTKVYGPSWVGDIIDAVGEGIPGSQCNPYTAGGGRYWTKEPTAIFVVWDDWGGWFDHVSPFQLNLGTCDPITKVCSCPQTKENPNGWGCGFTYGFRVPLLVVSPWTGTENPNGTYSGYVSGACGASPLPPCPNNVPPYLHDFGSILAFTKNNFNLPFIDLPDKGYADYNAPDWSSDHQTYVPLSDFFSLPLRQPRGFTHINTPELYTFFTGYYNATGAQPNGPDTY
jgi:hypothetical protein